MENERDLIEIESDFIEHERGFSDASLFLFCMIF